MRNDPRGKHVTPEMTVREGERKPLLHGHDEEEDVGDLLRTVADLMSLEQQSHRQARASAVILADTCSVESFMVPRNTIKQRRF